MQIIIPMSGTGARFQRAGYGLPKPLIEIDGKPVIGHVIDLFPGETNFIFVCNQDHLADPALRMEDVIRRYCATGKVVGIAPHKRGPVHAVLQVVDLIDPREPAVVNYCDFACYWNWRHFRSFVTYANCVGAIPAYRGFHPHTLGTTNYAYMRVEAGWVLDIQEKQPYTNNRMQEYASSGTYYFATGRIMLDAFHTTVSENVNVAGEFYISLAYRPLLRRGDPVAIYELQHFMQLGTPEDVAEFCRWSDTFRCLVAPQTRTQHSLGGTVVVPMAGIGKRFVQEGYAMAKPLIPVSGLPMVVQAARDLPRADCYVFALRSDMPGFATVSSTLRDSFPRAWLETLDKVTEGQACTAVLGLQGLARSLDREVPGPITFGACDSGALYDFEILSGLLEDEFTDVIVWAVRGHTNAIRHPTMYGWIDVDGDVIRRISVKIPLADPVHDPIVLGTFTFKRAEEFYRCVDRMVTRNARVNGEFYLDTCINDAIELGLRCRIFEVDHYISWGTPDDLRTFEYWQSCFHKWLSHPYRLERDERVPLAAREKLEAQYRERLSSLPTAPE